MINEELKQKATDYFNSIPELEGQVPSELLIDFVIEKYKEHRSYPPSFTDEKIENDMRNHMSTMAMAVVDILVESGAEGETSHSENGINRTYENAYISESIFKNVFPYVNIL